MRTLDGSMHSMSNSTKVRGTARKQHVKHEPQHQAMAACIVLSLCIHIACTACNRRSGATSSLGLGFSPCMCKMWLPVCLCVFESVPAPVLSILVSSCHNNV